MKPIQLSPSLREFLLEIYQINERAASTSDPISIADLTQFMFISSTALNRAILRLKELGLVEHQPYHGIWLTEAGRREAAPWIRRYRIAEVFLHQVMGLAWHEVHDEARGMIGGMNARMTQRMYELAGQPQTCPHGEPIPSLDGSVSQPDDCPIPAAPLKTDVMISRVLLRDPERLKYIGALRLVPGTTLQVIHAAPFDGPLQIKLDSEYRIIGHNLAEMIYVHPAPHP